MLEFAFEASRRGAGLTVTHVWDEPWIVAWGQQDPGIVEDVSRIQRERDDHLAAMVRSVHKHHPDTRPFHQIAIGSARTRDARPVDGQLLIPPLEPEQRAAVQRDGTRSPRSRTGYPGA